VGGLTGLSQFYIQLHILYNKMRMGERIRSPAHPLPCHALSLSLSTSHPIPARISTSRPPLPWRHPGGGAVVSEVDDVSVSSAHWLGMLERCRGTGGGVEVVVVVEKRAGVMR